MRYIYMKGAPRRAPQASSALKELELRVLRRHAACLESLRRFEATAEAEDECGRRRLWVEYRRGGAASEGRGRHHVLNFISRG